MQSPATSPSSSTTTPPHGAPGHPAGSERGARVDARLLTAAIPGLIVVAVLIWWAADDGGYPPTVWYPGALGLLALLATVRIARPDALWLSRPARIAAGGLFAYAAWSGLSVLWAGVPGDAWDGANRTLLYAVVFTLFAGLGWTARAATLVLGAWTAGVVAVVAVVLVALATSGDPQSLLIDGRLGTPTGYPNATAALCLLALLPALVLAARRELAWPLRGAAGTGAALLAGALLLAQSRGALLSLPVVLVLAFVLVPGRLRLLVTALPIAAAVAVAAPALLDVLGQLDGGADAHNVFAPAIVRLLVAALVAGALLAALGLAERRRPLGRETHRRMRRAAAGTALAVAVVVAGAGLVAIGNPVTRAQSAWDSFKGGYAEQQAGESRLSSGLGSNRYDFYRVALDEWRAHPAIGVGADNFAQDYLVHGRSTEMPAYPHSVELRTLAQTGLIGVALLLLAFGAALVAAAPAIRAGPALARATAAAAVLVWASWIVHGSGDWLWEFPGLGAAACALLGLAAGLAPRRTAGVALGADGVAQSGTPARRGALARRALAALAVVLAIGAAASLLAPWLAARDTSAAASSWGANPSAAFARLDRAARWNPLSDRPLLAAGAIALRVGDVPRAQDAFARALDRVPRGAFATLELGVIAASEGHRARAVALLRRAVALSPRNPLARDALDRARRGERIDVTAFNRRLLGATPS